MMDIIRLNAFNQVSANARSIVSLANLRGYSVHGIMLQLGGTTFDRETHISAISSKLGSKEILGNISGTHLNDQCHFLGCWPETDTDLVFIPFGNPEAKTAWGQHLTDIDYSESGYGALDWTLDVSIGAATAPTLSAFALVGPPKAAMGLGYQAQDVLAIKARQHTQISPAAAVTRQNYPVGLGSQAGSFIQRLFFHGSNLTSVQFKKAGVEKWPDLTINEIDGMAEVLGATLVNRIRPTAVSSGDFYPIDFCQGDSIGSAEPTIRSDGRPWPMQVNVTTSGAATIDIFAELRTWLAAL